MSLSIKIGHRSFTVRAMTDAEQRVGNIVGQLRFTSEQILVWPKASAAEQARILLHEILHGVFEFSGDRRPRWDEESVISLLDGPLTMVLKDNPELFAVLHQALAHGRKIVGGSEEPGEPLEAPSAFLGGPVASPLPERASLH